MAEHSTRLIARSGKLRGQSGTWKSEHIDLVQLDRRARAAYNFVPLPEKVVVQKIADVPTHDAFHRGLLSGRIDCALETLQPLFVRGAWTPDNYRTMKSQPQHGRNWTEEKNLL